MDRPSHCLSAVCNGASLRGLFMPLADSPGLRISPLLHLSPQRAHLPHVPPESNTMQYNTSHSPQKFPHKKNTAQPAPSQSNGISHFSRIQSPSHANLQTCKPHPFSLQTISHNAFAELKFSGIISAGVIVIS